MKYNRKKIDVLTKIDATPPDMIGNTCAGMTGVICGSRVASAVLDGMANRVLSLGSHNCCVSISRYLSHIIATAPLTTSTNSEQWIRVLSTFATT